MSAISSMINDGHRDLVTIVILRGFDRFEIINPCEKCRILIKDLNSNAQVIVGTIDKPYQISINEV
jgi:cytidine deaminase